MMQHLSVWGILPWFCVSVISVPSLFGTVEKMSKKIKKVVIALASVLLFILLVSLFIPHYAYEQTDRHKVSEMLMVASQIRSDISSDILLNKPILVSSNDLVSRSQYISYAKVTQHGEIFLFSEKLGAFIVMTPSVEQGEMAWTCYGQPLKIMPYPCQGRSFKQNNSNANDPNSF